MKRSAKPQFRYALLAALLLAGCAVGPDFHAPAPPATRSYLSARDAGGQVPATAGGDMPDLWWTAFRSAPLDRTMDEALANNPDLKAAQGSLAQARDVVAATAGTLAPQVDLNGTAGRQKYGVALFGPSDFAVPPFTYYEIGPSLSYALDYTGALHRAVERDRALSEVQAYQRDAAYLTLAGNVATQALTMAAERAAIDVSNAIVAEDEKNVRLVQTTLQAGTGTRTELLTAQSQLANDRGNLPASSQRLDTARHALAVLAGHAPGDWSPPEFTFADFTLPRRLPLSLPSELVHRRPDILAAEGQLHAASAAVGVATGRLYPQITLNADTLQEALNPAALFKSSSNAFGLAANLTAPILDGGTRRAERRAAIDAYRVAEANYQKIVVQAFGQVADTLQAIRHDREQVAVQTQAVKTANDALSLSRQSYAAGNTGILQVVDVERQASQARLGLVRANAQLYLDAVQLYLALGGKVVGNRG